MCGPWQLPCKASSLSHHKVEEVSLDCYGCPPSEHMESKTLSNEEINLHLLLWVYPGLEPIILQNIAIV
jgi:hypothetical protein